MVLIDFKSNVLTGIFKIEINWTLTKIIN